MRQRVILFYILVSALLFASCTKDGDVIYQTDPAEFIRYTNK